MYLLPLPSQFVQSAVLVSAHENSTSQIGHRSLAHINSNGLSKVHNFAEFVPKVTGFKDVCRTCELRKAHKLPFPGRFERATQVGEIIRFDIFGKLEMSYPYCYRYVCAFLDDYSRFTFLGFLQSRVQLNTTFNMVTTKLKFMVPNDDYSFLCSSATIELRSDGAKEYQVILHDFGGEARKISYFPPYTPKLDAIVGRTYRSVIEAAHALPIQADLPKVFWPFRLRHVIFIWNRVPHSTAEETLFTTVEEAPRPQKCMSLSAKLLTFCNFLIHPSWSLEQLKEPISRPSNMGLPSFCEGLY